MNQILRAALILDPARYYAVIEGQVYLDTTPYYLKHIPAEWLDMELKTGRSRQYSGMFRSYTAPVKFYKDGAQILRHIFDIRGAEGKCYLQVERLNSTSLTYEAFFIGALNFLETVDDQGSEDYIQVTVLDSGIAAMIRANEDIVYEVPITGPDVVQMELNALLLEGSFRYASAWPPPYSIESVQQGPVTIAGFRVEVPYHVLSAQEFLGSPVTLQPNTDLNHARLWLFQAETRLSEVAMTGHLNYYLKNSSGSTANYSFQLLRNQVAIHTYHSGSLNDEQDILLQADLSYHLGILNPGDTVGLKINFDQDGDDNIAYKVEWETGNPLEVKFRYHTAPIAARGLRWYKVMEHLLKQMTGGMAKLDISFLGSTVMEYQNAPYQTVLTSGDAIRGLATSPYTYPVIKTSFSELWKDGFSRWCIGMHIEGDTVHVQKMAYYFNASKVIAHLGRPAHIKRQPAREYLANSLRIGSRPQEHNGFNGRDDAHTTQIYKLPVLRAVGELDLTTPYYPSPYAIFFTWAETNLQNTKDNKNDNNIFVVDIAASPVNGVYGVYVPQGWIDGVTDVSNYYNYGETPKSCFFRHRRFLKSILHGLDSEYIRYQTVDRNAHLRTTFGGITVDEDSDIKVNQLGEQIHFVPVVYELEIAVSASLFEDLKAHPGGCVEFTDMNQTEVKMFLLDVGMKWGAPNSQIITGLLAPSSGAT